MNIRLAKILSYVGHPGFMPTVFFALLFFMGKGLFPISASHKWMLLALIANITLVLPLLLVLILLQRGYVSSLHIPNREERQLPFLLITISYSVLAYLFSQRLKGLPICSQAMIGMAITQALATIITPRFKISMHGLGLGGLLGGTIALQVLMVELDLALPILATILLSGLVLSARLALNAHTSAQAFAGLGLGALVNFLAVWLGA